MSEVKGICPKCKDVQSVCAEDEAAICTKCGKAFIVEKAIKAYEDVLASFNAVCPKCGRLLFVDSKEEAAVCEGCGKAFIVEKAMKAYAETLPKSAKAPKPSAPKASPMEDFTFADEGVLELYEGKGGVVVIPDCVVDICEFSFSGSDTVTEVVVPQNVKRIGTCAFIECDALKRINIPASVISIEDEAFSMCYSLESVEFESLSGWSVDGKPISVSDSREMARELVNGKYAEKRLCHKR